MAKASTDIRSLARAHTERAVQVLAGLMNNENTPAAARISAAQYLLDRGWGKAKETLTIVKKDATDWSSDELVAFIRNAANGGEGMVAEEIGEPGPDSVH